MPAYIIPEYKSTTLVQHIADTINTKSEIKYCFILGAGASKSSGISTGYELSKTWFDDIKRIFPDYQKWITDKEIDENNLAKYYGKIYKKRFEINPVEGYEFLQKEMAKSSPSFGYSILSQLLEKQHNVVITTNFDSLVEDALFLYSENKPLICGHESLSEFVKPTTKRPIIIKVHRDLLLNPKNEDGELLNLEQGFAESLDRIFLGYTPIVIGYGGNDLSLMNYLKECNSIKSIFWCKLTNDNLSDEIKELLENKKGKVFEIAGYDELMFQVYAELFKDTELDKRVQSQAEKRANAWAKQLIELSKDFTDEESKESLSKITKDKLYKDWWDVQLAINAEKDINIKNKIYLDGLNEFPNSPELIINYAGFLHSTNHDDAEKYYQRAIELAPDNYILCGNYALFLNAIKNDYDEAEKYYKKALEIDPSNLFATAQYARFLKNIRKDYDQAERYYLMTLENVNVDSDDYSAYALFLNSIRHDYDQAEKYYRKALEIKNNNANANINYAQLLIGIGKSDLAKKYIKKGFESIKEEDSRTMLAELWLYCFANYYDEYPNAKQELDKLIAQGIKSEGWDFSANIKKAKEANHPEIDKVIEYAEKISGIKLE